MWTSQLCPLAGPAERPRLEHIVGSEPAQLVDEIATRNHQESVICRDLSSNSRSGYA
jgi:hypothetical protein